MSSEPTELPLADRIFAWAATHRTQVIRGAIVVAIVAAGIGAAVWHHYAKLERANEDLSRVQGHPLTDKRATAAELLKVATDHADTPAGQRAALLAGGTLYKDG